MVILSTGENDLKSNQNRQYIANEIINLAKNTKTSGTKVSISSLIPRGDQLSKTGKKINKELQEKCTAENFAFILHKNINSKLDLFPDKFILIKKVKVFLKKIQKNLVMNMFGIFHKGIMSLFKVTIFR